MGRSLIFFLFLFFSVGSYSQQTWMWAKDGASPSVEFGNDITTDIAGTGVYVCGNFRDNLTATFGPSFSSTYGGEDGFVAKYDINGNLLWAFKIGGTGPDNAEGIAVDSAGNFYVSGNFSNTASFKGVSTSGTITLTSIGNLDSYLAKYNSGGELIWVRQGSNNNNTFAKKIFISGNRVFTAGYFDGNANFSYAGLPPITAQGGTDAFIAIHDLNGNAEALLKIGGNDDDYAYSITADQNNFYVVGHFFSSALNFYQTNLISSLTLNNVKNGSSDIFYASYSKLTNIINWANTISSTSSSQADIGYGIASDGSNIYLTGGVAPNPNFPGLGTISGTSQVSGFLSCAGKLTGQHLWTKVFTDNVPLSTFGRDVKVFNDLIWVTGDFSGTTNFGGLSLTSLGAEDMFVCSYKKDGTIRYAKSGGEAGSDKAFGLSASPSGTIYTTGMISGSAIFDATQFNQSNDNNFFISKLGCSANAGNISDTSTIFLGQSATITFNFSGSFPLVYTFTDGSSYFTGTATSPTLSLTVSPGVTTTYTLAALTSTDFCDAADVNLTGTALVTVLPPPPAIANNTISSDQQLCSGQTPSMVYGTYPSGGDNTYTYLWEESNDSTTWIAASGINDQQNYAPGLLTSTKYLRRIVYSSFLSNISNVVTLTAYPLLSNNVIADNQSICSGQSAADFTASIPSGGSGSYIYLWEESNDSVSWNSATGINNFDIYSAGSISTSKFYRRKVSSSTCSDHISNVVKVTVLSIITGNTISSSQLICNGQGASVLTGTMPAGGNNNFTYIWQESVDSANWSNASGVNTLFTYDPGSPSSSTFYRRLVSSLPCETDTSNVIKITVQAAVTNNTITSDQIICSGQTPATLSGTVPAGGDGSFIYSWQQSADSIIWSAATGTNNLSSYSPAALTSTTYYRRQVISSVCTHNSNVIKITVDAVIGNNTITANQTICSGQTPDTLSGSAPSGGNGSYIYLWEQSSDSLTWTAAGGTNNLTDYSPGALALTTFYRRQVSSSVCSVHLSNVVEITVDPQVTNNSITSNQTICSGQIPSALSGSTPLGGNGSYTFLWQESYDSLSWSSANGINNLGNYDPAALSATTYYRRLVNSSACAMDSSNVVKITVRPQIGNNIIFSNQTICIGTSSAVLTGTSPNGGDGSFTYQWQQSSDSLSWITATGISNTNSYAPGSLTSSTYYRRLVSSGPCAADTSNIVLIHVEQLITNNTISGTQSICSGQAPSVFTGSTPVGGSGNYSYLWESSSDSVSWTAATGSNTSQIYSSGPITALTYFRRIVTGGACSDDTSSAIKVTVYPVITNNAIDSNQVICSGTNASLLTGSTPTGGNGSYTYFWLQSADSITWSSATGINNQQNYDPSVTATTYFIRLVGSASCFADSSSPVKITVIPTIANNVIGNSDTICNGQSSPLLSGSLPASGDGNYQYLWEQSADQLSWITGTGSYNSQNYQSAVSTTTFFRRHVTSSVCSSTSNIVEINVLPAISNNIISGNQTLCYSDTPSALSGTTATGSIGTFIYLWEASTDGVNWTPASGSNALKDYTPGALSTTTYFRRLVRSAPCDTDTSNVVTVEIISAITNNTISSDQVLCPNQSASVLTGATPSGGNGSFTYLWESSADSLSWTAAAGTNTLINYAPGAISNSLYFRRLVSGGCQDTSNVISVKVVKIENNVISDDQFICAGVRPDTIFGSVATSNFGTISYSWQESSDSVTWVIAQGTNDQQNYAPPLLGSKMYYMRIALVNACPYISNIVSVSINPGISNNIISGPAVLCSGRSATLTGSVPSAPGSIFYTWEQSSNGITWLPASGINNIKDYTSDPLTDSAYFRRIVSVPGCLSSISDSIKINIQSIQNNLISSSQVICSGQQFQELAGSLPAGGTGIYSYLWMQSNDNISWVPAAGMNTGQNYPSDSIAETLYFIRLVSSGVCDTSDRIISNAVQLQVLPPISNNIITSNQELCFPQTPAQLIGSDPAGGNNSYTFYWEISNDSVNWATAAGLNTGRDYMPQISTGKYFFRRITSSGPCNLSSASLSNIVSITIHPEITANTISGSMLVCYGGIPSVLSGSIPSGGIGTYNYSWEQSTDQISWSTIAGAQSTDLQPGALFNTTYFRRTVTSGVCTTESNVITVTVNPSIVNTISGDKNVCNLATPPLLDGSANITGDYIFQWLESSDNFSWSVASGVNSLQNYQPQATSSDKFFRRIVSSNGCIDTSSAMKLSVVEYPSVSISGSDTLCAGEAFTLRITLQGDPPWDLQLSDGSQTFNVFISSPAYEHVLYPSSSTTYSVVSLSDATGCIETNLSVTASAEVHQGVNADAGSDQQLCSNFTRLNANTSTGSGTWTIPAGLTITDQNAANAGIEAALPGTYLLTWSVSDNICASSDQVSVTFRSEEIANAGVDQKIYFEKSTMLIANRPLYSSGHWELLSGAGTIITPDSSFTEVKDLETGINVFKWTVDNPGCIPTEDEVIVEVVELNIPNTFTPNGDNINEKFIVSNIEQFKERSLVIINRWGLEVFRSAEYNNDFTGRDNNNVMLPSDTYFFQLTLDGRMHTGYVILKRD